MFGVQALGLDVNSGKLLSGHRVIDVLLHAMHKAFCCIKPHCPLQYVLCTATTCLTLPSPDPYCAAPETRTRPQCWPLVEWVVWRWVWRAERSWRTCSPASSSCRPTPSRSAAAAAGKVANNGGSSCAGLCIFLAVMHSHGYLRIAS